MRILYFHQHFSTPKGSAGTRSYEMARRLVARGHQVTIVCGSYSAGKTGLTEPFSNGCRRGVVDGINVIEYDLAYSNRDGFFKRSTTFLLYALRCVGLVFSEPADLIFATTTPLTAGIPGIAARLFTRKPFVFEVRDLWPELPKAMGVIRNPVILRAMGALEWASYHAAHRLVALAPGIAHGIEARGISSDKIAVIPNGCDLDIFSAEVQPWRPDGVTENDLLAIFTGTHGVANGLDAVLDAARELKRRGRNDIKLALVGDGKLKPALQKRASQEGLTNVIFVDPVDKVRLAGLMESADIGMQILANVPAFYFGTSPNKFFDYIAAGLPVLNNYPGWLAEQITTNRCGFAVPPENPLAFADALEQAAGDRSSLVQMGHNSRELAKASYARNTLGNRFVEWLESAATPNRI
ncbi:glycosyltransferase family 4 protein [Rhizobium helianthi]|uniref:Glycosyltransferase family 4 protein n=1 Tax=Rhizobium helianthi TaxID=1132695 RepID=A0ABW4M764_9HYPH